MMCFIVRLFLFITGNLQDRWKVKLRGQQRGSVTSERVSISSNASYRMVILVRREPYKARLHEVGLGDRCRILLRFVFAFYSLHG